MLSARELSPARLPAAAQTWVNSRLQFTHGYGAVVSPVNEVVQEGLPSLLVENIPVTGDIPITRPEIYYGEEPDRYIIVKTKDKEFDYQTESGNVETSFEGKGGVRLGSFLNRLIFAWDFSDPNIAISSSLTGDSRILFRRNIADRVRTLAPFLKLDRDPYLVIADGRLFWSWYAVPPVPGSAPFKELMGKRFFFTGLGRWSAREVGSCGSCHPDGLSDNVTWIFGAHPPHPYWAMR